MARACPSPPVLARSPSGGLGVSLPQVAEHVLSQTDASPVPNRCLSCPQQMKDRADNSPSEGPSKIPADKRDELDPSAGGDSDTPQGMSKGKPVADPSAIYGVGKDLLSQGVNKLRGSVPVSQPIEAFLLRKGKATLNYLVRPCKLHWGLLALAAVVLFYFWNNLLAPGALFASFMAHDNFIFIDGVHRVWDGCVPHLDFVTGLGFLNFVGPALAQPFTDSEVMALLHYQMWWVVLAVGFSLYLGITRLHNASTIVLLVYSAAIVGAPSNIGDNRFLITMAMFYNRYGWALLTFAFLILLPRRKSSKWLDTLDACMLAAILFLSAYTKITYFVAIAGMYGLAALLYRREFLLKFVAGGTLFLVLAGLIELLWPGIHAAYFVDLKQLSAASNGAKFNVLSGIFDMPREIRLLHPGLCPAATGLHHPAQLLLLEARGPGLLPGCYHDLYPAQQCPALRAAEHDRDSDLGLDPLVGQHRSDSGDPAVCLPR